MYHVYNLNSECYLGLLYNPKILLYNNKMVDITYVVTISTYINDLYTWLLYNILLFFLLKQCTLFQLRTLSHNYLIHVLSLKGHSLYLNDLIIGRK